MYLSRADIVAGLVSRMTGTRAGTEGGERAAEMSLLRLAKARLDQLGVKTAGLGFDEIFERASTSDFPALVEDVLGRVARTTYDSYPGGLRKIARKTTNKDFRAKSAVVLSEAPPLLPLNEAGEFVEGKLSAGREQYALSTYGRVVALSSRLLRNDDVAAFADMATAFGTGAAEFVSSKLASLLASNPTMSDGVALFHASHGNLAAAAALSEASVGELLKMVYSQKGPGGQSIASAPKFLVVPSALSFAALKLVASITPAGSQPPLEVIVEPRLDASSATAFYVVSDPAVLPCIEYAYLDGDEGPRVELRSDFRSQNAQWRVSLDFGAGVVEYRAIAKNPGA